MESLPKKPTLHVLNQSAEEQHAASQNLPEDQSRQCPYCNETISLHARKCWRCHEYFSPPREDLDDRVFQFARREVLQDVVFDIKKWIARIGFGSVAGIMLVTLLGTLRFQDVLEDMVSNHVQLATAPVLESTEEKLKQSETVLDEVQDNIRLAQHRIAQFDRLDEKLVNTEDAVRHVEDARQSLETKAGKLAEQFEQLESRFINAKRELRVDREKRLEEMLSNYANQVVTFEKLYNLFATVDTPQSRQMLTKLQPIRLRRISLTSPFSLSGEQPTVVFSPSVQLEWRFEGYDLGEVTYRVHYDRQRDFSSERAMRGTTRLAKMELPPDFQHGPVYWRVEAVDGNDNVLATSDVGYFELYENSIDRIRSTGSIRVGVACSVEGEFAYFDKEHGHLTGYDIELTRWLAPLLFPENPNVRPVFIAYNWNRLLDSVRRNEVDFIISTITITPDREEEYGLKFTHPYYKTSQACVVFRDSGVRSPLQLRGRRIAVQAGTSSETVGVAFTEPANLHRVETPEVAFEELIRRQVDAVITDFDFAQSQVRRLQIPAAVIALKENDFPSTYSGVRQEAYGIAVAKNEADLVARLNSAIDQAASKGVLETFRQQFITGTNAPLARRGFPIPQTRAAVPQAAQAQQPLLR